MCVSFPAMGLGEMVAAGADRASLLFLHGGFVATAGCLSEQGASYFSDTADASAVGVLLTNDVPSVSLMLGAIATGARLASLPLPSRGGDLMSYVAFVQGVCHEHGIERVVGRDDVAELLTSAGIDAIGHSALEGEALARPTGGGFELVQFSSGSTGRPKGIRLSDDVLGANVAAIVEAVRPGEGDVAVSWLPLSHDMGLIGMLLTSIVACADITPEPGTPRIVLLEPERFLYRPALWLDAIDRWRGSFTAAPDFGLRLACARRPARRLDLSSLQCAIVGGEIVRASTLEHFEAVFGGDGLSPLALCPAYGMAEIGLAATMTRPDERWIAREVDPVALADGAWSPAQPRGSSLRLVASGRPLEGYGVSIDAPSAAAVGTIELEVPCAGRDAGSGLSYADERGIVTTGDRGIVDDDLLYVCGRSDDHIVAAGRNLYAPAIEDAVSEVVGVRPGRTTVVDTPGGAWIIVVERESRERLDATEERRLRDRVQRAVVAAAGAAPDEVAVIGRGELPMTSSGKVQRHAVRSRWMIDGFGLSQVRHSPPVDPPPGSARS